MSETESEFWGIIHLDSHPTHPYEEDKYIRLADLEAFGRTPVFDILHMRSGRDYKFPAGAINFDSLINALKIAQLGEVKAYHFDKAMKAELEVRRHLQQLEQSNKPQIVPVGIKPTIVPGR